MPRRALPEVGFLRGHIPPSDRFVLVAQLGHDYSRVEVMAGGCELKRLPG